MADRATNGGGVSVPLTPARMGVGPLQTNPNAGIVRGDGADWFGPGNPLAPAAPPEVRGRAFDIQPGYNINQQPRANEQISFALLRGLADAYDLLRLAIETRKDQMAALTWKVVPVAEQKPDEDQIEASIKIRKFLKKPQKGKTWDVWLRMLLEDLLVIDAATIYPRFTVGGDLYELRVFDGATIKRVIDDWGETPEPPYPAYQQVLKGLAAVDYTADELIYRPRNQRSNKVYGFSPVEQVLTIINIALRRETWQLKFFTEGTQPDALMGTPEDWTPDQVRAFQDWWDTVQASASSGKRGVRFVPGDAAKSYVPTKETELFGQAEEWLARVICFAFSLSPQAFVTMMNRATADTQQEMAIEEGLQPLKGWVKNLIDHVIQVHLKRPDLQFVWDEEEEIDQKTLSEMVVNETKIGLISLDEGRKAKGLEPLGGVFSKPMVLTGSGYSPVDPAEANKLAADLAQATAPPPPPGGNVPPGGGKPAGPPESGETPPSKPEAAEKFDPSQPRDPAGTSTGGQWSKAGATATDNSGVNPVALAALGEDGVERLRELIANRAPMPDILEALDPAAAQQAAVPATIEEGVEPDEEFWKGRTYEGGLTADENVDRLVYDSMHAATDEVAFNRQMILVTGPPAAGKSTIAESLAEKAGAAILDADFAKATIPEYQGGLGAAAVHQESKLLTSHVAARLMESGVNIVHPIIGHSASKIRALIDEWSKAGYAVKVVNMAVTGDEAARRMAGRFLATGRLIEPSYFASVAASPVAAFSQLRAQGGLSRGYAQIDANGPPGSAYVIDADHGPSGLTVGGGVFGKGGRLGAQLRTEGLAWGDTTHGLADPARLTKYRPDQPRDPKGTSTGGRFTAAMADATKIASLGMKLDDTKQIDPEWLQEFGSTSRGAEIGEIPSEQVEGLRQALETLDKNPDLAGVADWVRQTATLKAVALAEGDTTDAFTDIRSGNPNVTISPNISAVRNLDEYRDIASIAGREGVGWALWRAEQENPTGPLSAGAKADYWRRVFLHEIGHVVDHANDMRAGDAIAMFTRRPSAAAKLLSGYAATQPAEAFAEAFAMVADGRSGDTVQGVRDIVLRNASALSTPDKRSARYRSMGGQTITLRHVVGGRVDYSKTPDQAWADAIKRERSRPIEKFDPNQPRDDIGRWTSFGTSTDSPEFKAWFRDSVVVNADGSPKIVFHGTRYNIDATSRAPGIATFETGQTDGVMEVGAHFGTEEQAEYRLRNTIRYDDEGHEIVGTKNIIPAYLSIQNPVRLKDPGAWNSGSRTFLQGLKDAGAISNHDFEQMYLHAERYRAADIIRIVESHGFDGIVYSNGFEGRGDSYIAFRPEQIKSVWNRGTWSDRDGNISRAAPNDLGKYDPNQPRDPAGTPTGGQWTSDVGNEGADDLAQSVMDDAEEYPMQGEPKHSYDPNPPRDEWADPGNAQTSWEATPGASTGVLEGVLKAPLEQKQEYLDAVEEAIRPGGTDPLAEAAGLGVGQTVHGLSAWEGEIGAGAQTFVNVDDYGPGELSDAFRAKMDAYSAAMGYVMAQEAVAWHVPRSELNPANQNAIDVRSGRALTEPEFEALYSAVSAKFGTKGLAPAYTPRGARILNFEDGLSNNDFQRGMREVMATLPDGWGGNEHPIRVSGYRAEGNLVSNDWRSSPRGEDYRRTIAAGGPDLQRAADRVLGRVEAVNRSFAAKYGWGKPDFRKALALLWQDLEKYDPGQPRAPKGAPNGGQWVDADSTLTVWERRDAENRRNASRIAAIMQAAGLHYEIDPNRVLDEKTALALEIEHGARGIPGFAIDEDVVAQAQGAADAMAYLRANGYTGLADAVSQKAVFTFAPQDRFSSNPGNFAYTIATEEGGIIVFNSNAKMIDDVVSNPAPRNPVYQVENRAFNEVLKSQGAREALRRWTRDAALHEIGHFMDGRTGWRMSNHVKAAAESQTQKFGWNYQRQWVTDNISAYGAANVKEAAAEAFVMSMTGARIPPALKSYADAVRDTARRGR